MALIRFQNITKTYNPTTIALDNVSFNVERGEFASIAGRSGAGKTTLLKILLAEEKPSLGRTFFDGQNINKIKATDIPILRRRISAIFQDYKLLGSKNVYENVAYALEVIGASDSEISRNVPQVLDVVGLADKLANFPKQLSGGERQRVAIARALISRPDVILADEPTGNLDPYNTREIVNILLRINQMGTTVILATHNKEIINTLGKRVITLEKGKLIRDEKRGRFIL